MLVLTRRQNEKVNFPTLGITVEVLRTGLKKVQLGIDAPSEVRVVRDELAWHEDRPQSINIDPTTADTIRNELNSVAMAIRLSQNQLQQGLIEYAEEALDDAITLLERLEDHLSRITSDQSDANQVVREANSSYAVSSSLDLRLVVDQWILNEFAS